MSHTLSTHATQYLRDLIDVDEYENLNTNNPEEVIDELSNWFNPTTWQAWSVTAEGQLVAVFPTEVEALRHALEQANTTSLPHTVTPEHHNTKEHDTP